MQIICVSRGTFSGGKALAEKLASKMGYDCLSREELTDAATRAGIALGKLEMSVIQRRPLSEQMVIERERFRAFVTESLCGRTLTKSLVYHGRTGHLVLPGVGNVLRIRAIQDPERRIASVVERLKLSREKAIRYIEQVDEDRRRWVRTVYNVDWQDPHLYDSVINLSHMGVDNAASSLVGMAQLPDFQITPASRRQIQDLVVAARCRLAIGSDARTRDLNVQVRAENGNVSVTYLPRQERGAQVIPEVIREIEGVGEILVTMATTNLMWIQERFDPGSESLSQVLEIATKWNAAVELVQLQSVPGEEPASPAVPTVEESPQSEASETPTGGILDDDVGEERRTGDPGLEQTRQRLIQAGRAGAVRVVTGGAAELVDSLERTSPYSLVVVGNVFQSKGEAVRKRLSREMVGYLSDQMRVPVIGDQDLKSHYLFGPGQWIRMLVFGALAALAVVAVFGHQEQVLGFLSREGTANRILATAAILGFVPVFAFVYGNFSRLLLRLFKFE